MLLCDILSMNMIRSGCELEEENVDGEYSALLMGGEAIPTSNATTPSVWSTKSAPKYSHAGMRNA